MIINLEGLTDNLINEVKTIIDENYAETAQFDIPLDIDWDTYKSIDNAFKAFIMRDGNKIVGILFFVTCSYPHIKTMFMAQQVTFYVKPDYRKYSLKMIKDSEIYFESIGIDLIIQSARYGSDFCKVLDAKEYEPTDITYVKRIK